MDERRRAAGRPCLVRTTGHHRGRWLCAFALLVACGKPEPSLVPRLDLLDEFAQTDVAREREHIDLGTPDGDVALVEGWSAPTSEGEETLVRAIERRTSVRLVLGAPTERRLRLRCGDVIGGAGHARPRSPVYVSFNRRRIGVIHAGAKMEVFEINLPKAVQRPGANLLELKHPMIRRTPRGQSNAQPRNSVAYDWIEIETPDRAAGARAHLVGSAASERALALPVGARVDYFLRAPAQARLALEVTGASAPAPAELRIDVARAGGAARTLRTASPAPGERRAVELDLGTDPGEILQLSLTASGEGEARVLHPVVLGAVVPPASPAATDARTVGADKPVNVLLYVIDTLRADHLGVYGYPLPTSPRIDALARESVVFDRVVAQASWTKPAVASILTGLYPAAHGATAVRSAIRPEAATLAEILAGHGYATAAFVTNVNVSRPFGFARGFETFDYFPEDASLPSHHMLSDALNSQVVGWLGARDARPFFLYVHASDPHAPYTAGEDLRPRFRSPAATAAAIDPAGLRKKFELDWSALTPPEVEELVAEYDAEIAFNDASLGALLDDVKRMGLDDSTLVVVTADHGEEFDDHGGFTHGHTLYDEVIRVPLVIRLPGARRAGERPATLARQIDLLPTVLDEVGVATPPGLPGRALFAATGANDAPVEAMSHTNLGRREISALVTERWKVIEQLPDPPAGAEVFDLSADPHEKHSVAAEQPVIAGYGLQRIGRVASAAALAVRTPVRPPAIDPDTERTLRALGYAE